MDEKLAHKLALQGFMPSLPAIGGGGALSNGGSCPTSEDASQRLTPFQGGQQVNLATLDPLQDLSAGNGEGG